MGAQRPGHAPPLPMSAAELEERRKLKRIQLNQPGRGSTLLAGAGTSVDSVVNQTLLGHTR